MSGWKHWADVPKGVLVRRRSQENHVKYFEWFMKVDDTGGFMWAVEDETIDFVLTTVDSGWWFTPGDNKGGKFKEVTLVK